MLTTPMGPAIPLLAGILVLFLLTRWRHPQWHSFLALLAILLATVLWVRLRSGPDVVNLVRPWRSLVLPGTQLVWQVDGWAWLGGLLALLVTTIDILFSWDTAGWATARVHAGRLAALSAMLAMVSATNLLTLATVWVLLELTLVARMVARPQQAMLVSGTVGAVFLWLGLLLTPQSAAQAYLLDGALPPLTASLICLAVLWRAGFYPLHFWLLADHPAGGLTRLADLLLPACAGLFVLGRVLSAAAAETLRQPVWLALGLMALLGSALASWLEPDQDRSLLLVAVNRVTWVTVAAVLMPARGPAALAWPLLTIALGLSGMVLGLQIARVWNWRWPLGLAMITLLGSPLTVGFPVRASFGVLAQASDSLLPGVTMLPWLLIVLLEAIATAALLRHWPRRSNAWQGPVWNRANRLLTLRYLGGFVLFAAPLLAFGLRPALLAGWLGIDRSATVFRPVIDQIGNGTWGLWVGQALALGLGLYLARYRQALLARQQPWQVIVARIAGLDWLARGLRVAGRAVIASGAGFTQLFDGEGYVGWVLLGLLLAWLVVNR